jgi:hypothetical protein
VSEQRAVTVIARIRPNAVEDLERVLEGMGDGVANGKLIPFHELEQVHFARLFIVHGADDVAGASIPPSLVLLSDIDGPLTRYLSDLVQSARDGLDRIFAHCEDYPALSEISDDARVAFLKARTVNAQATYVNTIGRSVQQIRDEARLRGAIQDFLNRPGHNWSTTSHGEIHAAIREYVRQDPALEWARFPAAGLGRAHQVREALHRFGVPLVLILLSPAIIMGFPIWLVVLRIHERRDAAPRFKPDTAHVDRLASLEDHVVQNPFGAVGFLKPGRFRLFTARAVLWIVNYGTRHIYNKGQLTGVRTIHFARWVLIDDQRRLIFASNYDGSLDSYMDDFIDKVAWGLNAVFSNGVGYPKTDWLVFQGARDELAFKGFLRAHQIPTRVWYSAYPRLTARNIENNAAIRAGLAHELDDAAAERWLRHL